MPLVSIVVLNYNGKEFLERCLKSVLNSDYLNFEVILVDNASVDGSVGFVKERFGGDPRLKILRNDRNYGFAKGNNVGAETAQGDYIVFLNNDTEVDPNWLNELVKAMETDSSIGACQSKLLLMNDRKRIDCAGGYVDYFGFPLGRGDFEEDRGQYVEVEEIFHAKGAAMIVKREVLEEVGYFDPSFYYYYEEIDLCWRIRLRGYKVVFVPMSIVFHSVGFSIKRQPEPSKAFHATKNHIIMLIKNYSFLNLLKYLPVVVFFRFCEALLLSLMRKYNLALAKVKAVQWVLMNLRSIYMKRSRVQRLVRRVPDTHVIKYMRKPHLKRLYEHFSWLY